MILSFSEIKNWQDFENLTASYFKNLMVLEGNNIDRVSVRRSGQGSDGGIDMLVTFRFNDSVEEHEKKWVIQCKFMEKLISKSHLASANIPSLIHEHGADGYILICKNDVTSKVAEMFENLRKNCRFNYVYKIWNGSDFIEKISVRKDLVKHYFPKFSNFA